MAPSLFDPATCTMIYGFILRKRDLLCDRGRDNKHANAKSSPIQIGL